MQPLQFRQLELEISQFLINLESDQLSGDIPGGIEHLMVGDLHLHRLDQAGAALLLD